MHDDAAFAELFQRVCAGDQDAAAELVRQYEPEIRREVRFRLTDRNLRRTLDSLDICQSVLGNFLVRAALGQFDLQSPGEMLRLLVTMSRNKVIDHWRKEQARSGGQPETLHACAAVLRERIDPAPTPSSIVARRELLDEVLKRMTAEERCIADARQRGESWDSIAAQLGAGPDAVRKRLSRACDRVLEELNLDELGW
jgi:RNA polymerase sigma-70 factor (ECF subfamily)